MKKIITLTLLITLIFSLAGCTNNSNQSKDNIEKITVALDWFPNTNHTGLYVAKDQGFYEEENLEVNIVQPSEGGTAQLIAAGQSDFGISYQEEVTVARSQNIPIVAIAAIIQHNTSGFASAKSDDSSINIINPKDFENKSYGGWGSPSETSMLKALMEKHNADFEKVNMVNIGDTDFFTSLENGIDFSWIYYGWTGIEAELKGINLNFIKLVDEDKSLDFYTPVIISNEEQINTNPELVKKFLRATAKGYEFAINNPDEAAQILTALVPELPQDLVQASQNYLAPEYLSDASYWGEMNADRWKDYANFMYENKLIEKNIDTKKAFTNEFLPKNN